MWPVYSDWFAASERREAILPSINERVEWGSEEPDDAAHTVIRLSPKSLASGIVAAKSAIKIHTEMNNSGIAPKIENITEGPFAPNAIPSRKGSRPKTMVGPLHIQCNGHGDPKYLKQLVRDVLTWPYIEPTPSFVSLPDTIPIRLEEVATSSDSSAFIGEREFARVLLGAPTIYLALPLVTAHWAIVRGWAEPHYLRSFGLMPAGAVLVYTPKNRGELAVCYSLFAEAYLFACKFGKA
jgi:hypothetical protein